MSMKINGIGRLGKDAEIRDVGTSKVFTFSVAADYGFGDKKVTTWYDVECWVSGEKGIERANKMKELCKKGQQVFVSGDHTVQKGEKGSFEKIKVQSFNDIQLVGGKSEGKVQTANPEEGSPF